MNNCTLDNISNLEKVVLVFALIWLPICGGFIGAHIYKWMNNKSSNKE